MYQHIRNNIEEAQNVQTAQLLRMLRGQLHAPGQGLVHQEEEYDEEEYGGEGDGDRIQEVQRPEDEESEEIIRKPAVVK